MRIAVRGRNLQDLIPLLEPYQVEIDEEAPELVISYGGDGALLGAEREFPGVVKCPIRDTRSTLKCPRHHEKDILKLLFAGKLSETPLTKVSAQLDDQVVCTGLNDIVINRLIIASALRYRIWLDEQLYAHQIVGDGLVVSTPFGSTGYYRSITHSLFHLGLGLAFNNSTEPVNHLVIEDNREIRVEILRGPAVLIADNDPVEHEISKGSSIKISRAPGNARIMGLDLFRCRECYRLRHHHMDDDLAVAGYSYGAGQR
ncbi:MAG: hypothetical protein R6V56_08090 [Lentisphaeria bacterium]